MTTGLYTIIGSSRHAARLLAVQLLYQIHQSGIDVSEAIVQLKRWYGAEKCAQGEVSEEELSLTVEKRSRPLEYSETTKSSNQIKYSGTAELPESVKSSETARLPGAAELPESVKCSETVRLPGAAE
jgi:transcription termination factor NusB